MIIWWCLFLSCFSRLISSKRQRSYNLNFRLLEPMIDFKIVSKYEMRNNKNLARTVDWPFTHRQLSIKTQYGDATFHCNDLNNYFQSNDRSRGRGQEKFIIKKRCTNYESWNCGSFASQLDRAGWRMAGARDSKPGGIIIDERMTGRQYDDGIETFRSSYQKGHANQNYPIDTIDECNIVGLIVTTTCLKTCSENFITIRAVGNPIHIPAITMTGFYVSPIVQTFDPTANYIGFAILAIKDGTVWHHDGRKSSYRITSYQNGRTYVSRIKPGYVIMSKTEDIQTSPGSTQHAKVFHDFFGRTPEQFRAVNKEFVAVGFSYQAHDRRDTDELICDFKFTSGTFNAGQYVADAKPMPGNDGTVRSIDWQMENLLRFAINTWRVTGNRLIKISSIYSAANSDAKARNPKTKLLEPIFPACPNKF